MGRSSRAEGADQDPLVVGLEIFQHLDGRVGQVAPGLG